MLRADTAVWAAWKLCRECRRIGDEQHHDLRRRSPAQRGGGFADRRIEVDDDARAPSTPRQRGEDDDGPPVSCVPVSGFVGGGGVGLSLI